jgi:hypothetical protein
MAQMIADTISSCRIEQEGREEREVGVFPFPAFPIFLFKGRFFSAYWKLDLSLAFGLLAFEISAGEIESALLRLRPMFAVRTIFVGGALCPDMVWAD